MFFSISYYTFAATNNTTYVWSNQSKKLETTETSSSLLSSSSETVTDNSLGYILTQHFKSKGYTNSLVYSFNTLSFSKIAYLVSRICGNAFLQI